MSWNKQRNDLAGQPERVRAALLRYLGRREYTVKELEQRLSERGAAPEDIDEAISYAQERGEQDDARAGESHIRQRLAYAPRGRALVRHELRQRGLNAALTESLLNEHYPPEAEQELLRRLLAKEEQPTAADREQERRYGQKLARRLLAKGFSRELVFEALQNWFTDEMY